MDELNLVSTMIHKQRRHVAVRPIPSGKMPYFVRGTAYTILHLTRQQAARRSDLILQFQQPPFTLESPQR